MWRPGSRTFTNLVIAATIHQSIREPGAENLDNYTKISNYEEAQIMRRPGERKLRYLVIVGSLAKMQGLLAPLLLFRGHHAPEYEGGQGQIIQIYQIMRRRGGRKFRYLVSACIIHQMMRRAWIIIYIYI